MSVVCGLRIGFRYDNRQQAVEELEELGDGHLTVGVGVGVGRALAAQLYIAHGENVGVVVNDIVTVALDVASARIDYKRSEKHPGDNAGVLIDANAY